MPFNSVPGTVNFSGGGGGSSDFTLTIGSASNVMNGQQVCLNVTTAGFTDILGMQFSINYNPAMLQLTSVTNFGLPGLTAGGNFGLPIPGGAGMTAAGTITLSWTDGDLSGETLANGSTLFTLCFTALTGSGSSTVMFSNTPTAIEVTNTNLQTVPFNSVPGTVNFSGGGGGDPTGFTLTIGSASNVMSGQQVCLNVTTANFTNIIGMQFSISYNPSMLQLTSVTNIGLAGMTLGANFGLPIPGGAGMTSPGTITLSWTDGDLSGETLANGSTLFTLCFNALASTGSTTVMFSNTPTAIEITNVNLQTVPFNSVPGTVNFGSGPPPAGSITLGISSANNVLTGQQVCLNLTASNFTNISSLQLTINYNASQLLFASAGNFALQGLSGANFNTSTPGTITLTWNNPGGQTAPSGTVLFNLCFIAQGVGGSTMVTFGNSSAMNTGGQSVQVMGNAGTVSFGTPSGFTLIMGSAVNVQSGQQVCLNVTTANFNNIIGMQFSINYNPAMLQLTSVSNFSLQGMTLGANFGLPIPGGAGLTTPGTITVSWTDNDLSGETLANGSTLFTLCFNALANTGSTMVTFTGTPTAIEITNVMLQVVPFNSVPGTVTFGQAPSGDAPVIASPANITQVGCFGASTGAIDITVTGGSGNYSYLWSYQSRTTQDLNNIPAGTYSVTVTDTQTGLSTSGSFTVTQPSAALTVIAVPTNPNCTGSSTGAINLTVTGGTAPYNYNWSGTLPDGVSSQTGLAAGTYSVTVTDANNCTVTQSATLIDPPGVPLTISSMVQQVVCAGASTGRITLSITGGTSPYSISWCCGLPANQTTVMNLAAGPYSVTVTDNLGCTATRTMTVGENPPLVVNSITPTPIINGNDGAINITVTGGTSGYSFSWSGPPGFAGSTQPNLSGLNIPGQYCVTVTDNSGCTTTACVVLLERLRFGNVQIVSTCAGASTGTIDLGVTGGTPPYTYLWSPGGATTPNRTGLAAGTYNVTVTDQAGEQLQGSFVVGTFPTIAISNTVVVHDTENPGCIGSIALTLAGGSAPYTLQWNTPNTGGPTISNLCAGTFIATVTDANGCTFVTPGIEVNTFALSAIPAPSVCPNDSTAAIDLVVSGGRAPYTYEWRNAAGVVVSTNEDLGNVPPGTYTVRVTEGSGNELLRTFTVGSESGLALDVDVTSNYNGFDVSCAATSDGVMTATAFNGQGALTFEWRRNGAVVGGAGATLSGAAAGAYEVQVTDELGCSVVETLTLNAPGPIAIVANTISPSCVGGADGQVFATASGGVFALPYAFEWSNGAFGPRATFLRAGDYTVTVNDVNNCTASATFTVSSPAPITVTLETSPATDGCNGSILAVVNGGTAPYTFTWSNGQVSNSPLLTELCPGEYFVMVTDSRGCRPDPNLASGSVRDRRTPCLDIRTVITPDGDGLNEEFLISCVDEFRDNRLEIYNRWGQLVYQVENYDNTWSGTTRNGTELPDGPYYFVFEYTDIDNARQQLRGSITVLRK